MNPVAFLRKYFTEQNGFNRTLKTVLKYRPRNIGLFKLALTHKSAIYKEDSHDQENNERLEYLGDALLNAIVAEMLYRHYPMKNEGFLTKMRARMVSRETLNRIAENMGLEAIIDSNIDESLSGNILGNALEAVIGAIFLDAGFNRTRKYILKHIIRPHIDIKKFEYSTFDYKSQLIEWSQKNRVELIFEDFENPVENAHQPVFVSNVKVNDKILGSGKGSSKKEAQQKAAKEAFNHYIEF
ncbi:MAG: ribonuclease III [Bacteroidales bacterium]|nr:ribonuclease III [Bacteroidales bacterium]MBS3774811.1 ribonuclease III [Bacteroidales bacterium]